MKTPTLALTLSALILSAGASAQDHDGDGRVGLRDSIREAWYQLEDAGFEARERLATAVDVVKKNARDVKHERPFLLSEYVTVVKNGDKVVLVYCDTRLKRLADRQACEKLHNKSFKVDELKSCLATAGDNKQPGMILEKQLTKAAESEYGYDFFKMYDSKDSYKEYLKACEQTLAARKSDRRVSPPIAGRAKPEPAPAEFRPIEPATEPAALDQSGTL